VESGLEGHLTDFCRHIYKSCRYVYKICVFGLVF